MADQLGQPPQPDRHARKISVRSVWGDDVWKLDTTLPGTVPSRHSMHWDFELSDQSRFHAPRWTAWREAAKQFVWSLANDPPAGRKSVGARTQCAVFVVLRTLIRWMHRQGYREFPDLGSDDCRRFMADMAARPGRREGEKIKPSSLHVYGATLTLLYLQGRKFPELAIDEPPPECTIAVSRADDDSWPYTPDEIAVPLIQGALRLLGAPADDVIALRNSAQIAYDEALAAGHKGQWARDRACRAVRGFTFSTLPDEEGPWHPDPISGTRQVGFLVDRLYDAAFIVIAYLVGMRVSEILGLQFGCVERARLPGGSEEHTFVKGYTYKGGSPRKTRWVAPPCVARAIQVLEALSEPLRNRTGKTDIWLSARSNGLVGASPCIRVLSSRSIIERLNNRFADFIDLPDYQGEPWHLHPHQGRHTFGRLIGRKDRTNLAALKQHFGHRSVLTTDRFYVGDQFEVDDLIDQETRDEMFDAAVTLLTASDLAGPARNRIPGRSRFRGRTVDGEIREAAKEMIAGTDLLLAPCEYGVCLHRPETSACRGDHTGPNPVFRAPSLCFGCHNFIVTPKHLPWWVERHARHAEIAEDPSYDPASRDLARTRVAQCAKIIAELRPANPSPETGRDNENQDQPVPSALEQDGGQASQSPGTAEQ